MEFIYLVSFTRNLHQLISNKNFKMAFFIEQPDQEPVESELDPEVILQTAFYLNIHTSCWLSHHTVCLAPFILF